MPTNLRVEFIKHLIQEQAEISVPGATLRLWLTISNQWRFGNMDLTYREQWSILEKLQHEGYIKNLVMGDSQKEAFLELATPHKEPERETSVKIGENTLAYNKETGLVRLNGFSSILNPRGQELDFLIKLIKAENHQLLYLEALNGQVSKISKRNLTFVIRNLKTALGILPVKTAKNKDIIKNIKGVGYKLSP